MRNKDNLKYLLYALVFLLFFYAEKRLGISPFAIGLFMAAVYSKQNILFLAPIYIICGICVSPTLTQLAYLAAPVFIVTVSFLIHYKLKKAAGLLAISLYTFVSQIPKIIFAAGDTYLLTNTIITLIVAQIFTYICIMVLYAALIRGLRYKFSFEEEAAVSVFAAVIFMSLAIMTSKYSNIYYLAAMFAILLSLYTGGRWTLFLSVVIGAGGAAAAGDIAALGTMVLWGCCAVALKKSQFFLAGLGIILADVAINLFFTQNATFNYYHLIYQGAGVILFALLPRRFKETAAEITSDYGARRATRTIINRDRAKIAYKLSHLSRLFSEMKELLLKDLASQKIANGSEVVTRDVMAACCANCSALASCENSLNLTSAIAGVVSRSLENEKATLLDAPPYLAAKCKNINRMIKTSNTLAGKYNSAMEKLRNMDKGRMLVSEQLGGVGIILENLKKDIAKQVKYDTKREKQLIEALSYNDIIAGEVIIYGEQKADSVTVIVRESDQNNKKIIEIINNVMGQTLEEYYRENTLNNQVSVHYGPAANFDIIYGERSIPKQGEKLSGDCRRVARLTQNNIMVILSDGMGHGENAFAASSNAVDMLEHLYKAGFDHNTILTTANALLSVRKSEDFNAIDIVVIDTVTGVADFIKLGGRESFIKRVDNVEPVEAGALPIGILEDVVPVIEQRTLTSGDFVILATDGVMDTLPGDMLIEIMEECPSHNPQILADTIIDNALRLSGGEIKDDTTCIVLKIFEK
jgi:stage II sporulation protein E